jgi:FkbM family methyltransferase
MNKRFKNMVRKIAPKATRGWRIWAGPLRGWRIVTSWHDYPAAILGRTERPLLNWFGKNVRPGETWLDVGAHYGYTALALSRLVGSTGRGFAFDPMLSTAGYVGQTRLLNRLPQLTVLPLAMAAPADLELHALPTVRGMVDSTLQSGQLSETILVARFDWLWPKICGGQEQIDGIKIDVQGMEIEVLRGMAAALKAFRPKLVVEVHSGVDRTELLSVLKDLGYAAKSIPVEPIQGEVEPQYIDDRSYAFQAM